MSRPTDRLLWAAGVVMGLAGVVLGVTDTSGPQCGVPGLWKCLPGVIMAGRALWIGVGAAIAAMSALRMVSGRRPWATAIALLAGAIDLAAGGWIAYALITGIIPLADPLWVAWPVLVALAITWFGVGFFAAALSDKVMDRFRQGER